MGLISYMLGTAAGDAFDFDSASTADGTTAIATQYVSKRLNFLDQFPNLQDKKKAIHGVKLTYIDKGSVSVTVSVSSDGAQTWTDTTKTIGTAGADGAIKTRDFDFIVPGQYFNIKIYHTGTTGALEWVELEIEVEDMGEEFWAST